MTWPCPVQPGVGHFDPSGKVAKNGERGENVNFLSCSEFGSNRQSSGQRNSEWAPCDECGRIGRLGCASERSCKLFLKKVGNRISDQTESTSAGSLFYHFLIKG